MPSTRLANGIRVVSEELAALGSVTVGIWVENGSRYERPEQAGISHFLEHLFFKGTQRRTAAQIAEEIDAVGGVLNAFTGKEYTCYYAKVLDEHLPLALDLLADVFTQSQFAEEEIERERTVIVQGISQMDDDRYAAHLLNSALGGGMSSRLFQEIRERQGKAYTVYSFLTSYRDSGYTGVYVGTSREWIREVTDCIRGELGRVVRDG